MVYLIYRIISTILQVYLGQSKDYIMDLIYSVLIIYKYSVIQTGKEYIYGEKGEENRRSG